MLCPIIWLGALALMVTPTLAAPQKGGGPPHGKAGSGFHPGHPNDHGLCTEERIRVRQDFDTMAPYARKAYTDAVLCLMDQPSQLDLEIYPAALNRFFDYAVIHVNQTKAVHLNGFFLTWHRYFLHLYEEDLRNLCNYQGALPYWNWPATSSNLTASAIFDGSEYSMSGNGLYNNTGPIILSSEFSLPHGIGGGCVTTGPFANLTTTMTPIPVSVILNNTDLPSTAFNYSPSCLTRDLNPYVATTYTTPRLLESALTAPTAGNFSEQINGLLGSQQLGLHSGAHFTVGAPASSLFVSPMDPIWYPLHTMLDHVYASWQARHPAVADTLNGTMTALNLPPSADVELGSKMPGWGYLERRTLRVGDLVNTTQGPLCYRYDRVL